MEIIKVGDLLPSGRPIERLALVAAKPGPQAFRLLIADDGKTTYARQYPHLDTQRPDEWDIVGPYSGGSTAWDEVFGFDRQDLSEFVKDA